MALIEKETGRLITGIGVGAAALWIAPYALPIATAVVRPLVKVLVVQGLRVFENSRVALARALEALEDIVAEARVSVEQERERKRGNGDGRQRPGRMERSEDLSHHREKN